MRNLMVAAAVACGVFFTLSTPAQADYQIRVTEFDKTGAYQISKTASFAVGPPVFPATIPILFSDSLIDFTFFIVSNIAGSGTGFTSHSTTINVSYSGPTGIGGIDSDKLLIEVLGDKYVNPTAPALSQIVSNASPSTSGLDANKFTMTSGVISGNVPLGATGVALGSATLGGQLGMTVGTGDMGSASSVLLPNPAFGAPFSIVNPFTFYQTYLIEEITNSASGSASAGSTVQAVVPVPPSVFLVLAGLPILVGYCLLRRRKVLLPAC